LEQSSVHSDHQITPSKEDIITPSHNDIVPYVEIDSKNQSQSTQNVTSRIHQQNSNKSINVPQKFDSPQVSTPQQITDFHSQQLQFSSQQPPYYPQYPPQFIPYSPSFYPSSPVPPPNQSQPKFKFIIENATKIGKKQKNKYSSNDSSDENDKKKVEKKKLKKIKGKRSISSDEIIDFKHDKPKKILNKGNSQKSIKEETDNTFAKISFLDLVSRIEMELDDISRKLENGDLIKNNLTTIFELKNSIRKRIRHQEIEKETVAILISYLEELTDKPVENRKRKLELCEEALEECRKLSKPKRKKETPYVSPDLLNFQKFNSMSSTAKPFQRSNIDLKNQLSKLNEELHQADESINKTIEESQATL
jgi:hypothetical protein